MGQVPRIPKIPLSHFWPNATMTCFDKLVLISVSRRHPFTNEIEEWVGSSAALTPANTFGLPNLKKCSPKPLGEHRATSVFVLELRDVVRCIGAGERYVYRRNPGWTLITFINLKRPSSKLHKVKGWFSSKGFFQIYYCGRTVNTASAVFTDRLVAISRLLL